MTPLCNLQNDFNIKIQQKTNITTIGKGKKNERYISKDVVVHIIVLRGTIYFVSLLWPHGANLVCYCYAWYNILCLIDVASRSQSRMLLLCMVQYTLSHCCGLTEPISYVIVLLGTIYFVSLLWPHGANLVCYCYAWYNILCLIDVASRSQSPMLLFCMVQYTLSHCCGLTEPISYVIVLLGTIYFVSLLWPHGANLVCYCYAWYNILCLIDVASRSQSPMLLFCMVQYTLSHCCGLTEPISYVIVLLGTIYFVSLLWPHGANLVCYCYAWYNILCLIDVASRSQSPMLLFCMVQYTLCHCCGLTEPIYVILILCY